MKKRLVVSLAGLLAVAAAGFSSAQFSDVPAGFWASKAVEALAARGIIIGFPDGTFRGNEPLTRYQAAEIIYRLLKQLQAEIKAGQKPEISPETLTAIRNAVQELAAQLSALGVRVSDLESTAATKQEVAKLQSEIDQLKASQEQGLSQAAIAELAQQLQATSVTADTALAQTQELAGQVKGLQGQVSGLQGEVSNLNSQVQANTSSISALNDLAVLLNQDILSLQQRVSALESKSSAPVNLSEFATKQDLAGVQEYATALRGEVTKLSNQVQSLQAQVTKLQNAPQFSFSGSLSVTYGYTDLYGYNKPNYGTGFYSQGLFSLNSNDPFEGIVRIPPTGTTANPPALSGSSASATFGLTFPQPSASNGVAVSSASLTANFTPFSTGFNTGNSGASQNLSVGSLSVSGTVYGQNFSISYVNGGNKTSFNDFLFANNYAGTGGQDVQATLNATSFFLQPTLTVIAGYANGSGVTTNASYPFTGNYLAARFSVAPFASSNVLALSYVENPTNQAAYGVDTNLTLGPLSLNGAYDSDSNYSGGGAYIAEYLNPTLTLGPLTLGGDYYAVDPHYANGQAGLSTNYNGYNLQSTPYPVGNEGFDLAATLNLGSLLKVQAGYSSAGAFGTGSLNGLGRSYGVALVLNPGGALNLTGYYNANSTGSYAAPASYGAAQSTNQGFGGDNLGLLLAHNGSTAGALIPNLNLTLQFQESDGNNAGGATGDAYANNGSSGFVFRDLLAAASYNLTLGPLSLNPLVVYHQFTDSGSSADVSANPSYTTTKFGAKLTTSPLSLPLQPSLLAGYVQENTAYTGSASASEQYYTFGIKLNEFLASNSSFGVSYGHYTGTNVSSLTTGEAAGAANNAVFSTSYGYVFNGTDGGTYYNLTLGPGGALATSATQTLSGLYFHYAYSNFNAYYALFNYNGLPGQAFEVSYSANF